MRDQNYVRRNSGSQESYPVIIKWEHLTLVLKSKYVTNVYALSCYQNIAFYREVILKSFDNFFILSSCLHFLVLYLFYF